MFKQLYQEQYQHYFEKDFKINRNQISFLKAEEKTVNQFYEALISGDQSFIYSKDFLWNLTYSFLGELYSNTQELNLVRSYSVKFDKATSSLEVDYYKLFITFMVLRDKLWDHFRSFKGLGFRVWFKKANYDAFFKDLFIITADPKLNKNIIRGRSKRKSEVINQKTAIEMVKGLSLGDKKKIEEVFSICRRNNSGIFKKEFSNPDYLAKTAKQLTKDTIDYLVTKNPSMGREGVLKKWRITDTKSLKYLCYQGLMSTISTRKNRYIEINSRNESAFFGYSYKVYRDVCESKKWIKCVNKAFCPGVRSRCWEVKILNNRKDLKGNPYYLNDIEQLFNSFVIPESKTEFANKLSQNAYKYLTDREKIAIMEQEVIDLNKTIKGSLYRIHKFGKSMKKEWVREQYRNKTMAQHRKNFVIPMEIVGFLEKYSTSRAYDFPIYLRGTKIA